MSAAFGVSASLAQSGSAGGSIGNDEKSLSGSRATPRAIETEKPARRSKSEAESPRRASRSGGGGGGNFDGAWMVTSVGCGGTTTGAVVVTSGRIIAQGVSGSVSGNGSARTVGNFNGVTVTSSGRLSGRSGSGTFRQSTGCAGTWTASKQ
ncbi:hypothetical protein [Bradyrhizobium sp. JYMT SZCCT0180]|uniref:hypothetical protein n=1 Tax=Bradyrhizobium sp. JYMT SZCCT0180 TaxID=2807666 RepID=UPI002012EF4C|nr:hypothetical protein [Bradyrhizobium sp. JYMT SZCCT0180]